MPHATASQPRHDAAGDLNLGQLLGALSHALDLTEGQPQGHCVRACWIGTRIGQRLGLGHAELSDLYYALLLKDLGCSSNAARICQLYLTDDLTFKGNFKTVDGSIRQALAFVVKNTGRGHDLVTRLRTTRNVLRDAGEIAHEMIETRCHQGADIASAMGFSAAVCDGIQSLDEHWDGGGRPEGVKGGAIPLFSQIALISQVIDVFHRQSGRDAATREVGDRAGTWFDPRVVAAALACAADGRLWDELESAEIERRVFEAEPATAGWRLDDDRIDEVVYGFGRVIDAKSPFTQGHSARVAGYTDQICVEMGYGEDDRRWMRRAGLLHDIGKLGVSNLILDKPDRLTEAEFEVMKRHPTMGRQVLERVDLFRPMADLAAAHHERLDGAGYPLGVGAEALNREMRILTVADIFDALTADRPYRAAMPLEKAYGIMDGMRGSAIDLDCYAALKRAMAAA